MREAIEATPSREAIEATTLDIEPMPVTLGELISVLTELTDDEDEIVATAVHMVDRGRVRLIDTRWPS